MKRYRVSGKERDDETGFYYFGARYYAAWLGRWTSSDPAGFVDGANLYTYCRNNSILYHDKNGNESSANKELQNDFYKEEGGYIKQNPAFESTGKFTSIGRSEYAQYKNDKWGLVWVKFAEDVPTDKEMKDQAANGEDVNGGTIIGHGAVMTDKEFHDLENKSKNSKGEGSGGDNLPAQSPTPSALPDSAAHAGPGLEKGIWGRNPFDRGYTLEHMYNNNYKDAYKATRDNRASYDVETQTHVKQIKTNEGTNATQLRSHASKATRDAGTAVARNPSTTMAGKSPQAVVITPTDAPASAGTEIRAGFDNMRRPVPNATPPEHIRGLPGNAGSVSRGLTYGGTGVSAGFFVWDLAHGDYSMATADGISTAAGGLEIYALATPGATVAGVSAVSAGLALGGVGMALGSVIGAYRDFKAGNYGWGAVGVVGVLAGIAVTAGVIIGAPALIVGGLVTGLVVGALQLGRWISSWF
jgi:RHS repeat-associated protein